MNHYLAGVRSDQIGKPTLAKAREAFPSLLRKVRYFDAETQRDLVFLTKHLGIPALMVALIYRGGGGSNGFSAGSKATCASSITMEPAPTR